MTTGELLRAQAPLGNWLPPMKFTGTLVGCGGNQGERFYGIHSSVIPVGPNRGKLLIWDKSSSLFCSQLTTTGFNGNRDQRWAIVDPEASPPTIAHQVWTIPEAFAPAVYRQISQAPQITHGAQGLFCSAHCWLPDGRLMVIGGDDWLAEFSAGYAEFTGSRLVCIYDPLNVTTANPNGTWSTLTQLYPGQQFLHEARWYPTIVIAYDPTQGTHAVKVIVLGGIEEFTPGPADSLPAPSNGIFLATDRAYLTHEAYNIVATTTPGQNWTISKDMRGGGTLPVNYTPNTPVAGLFIGPSTAASVAIPDFRLGLSLFYYSRAHYLSDGVLGGATATSGIVWSAGMPMDTAWIDHPSNQNVWGPQMPVISTAHNFPMLEEPTALLLPASLGTGGEDRIALFGGEYGMDHNGPVSNDVFVLDTRAVSPMWSSTAIPPMNHARKFPNAVNLPDRSILVTGGGTNSLHGSPGGEVFTPEVFRGTVWEECAAEASPRTYHSGTLVLGSGRVVTLGGDSSSYDLQVFEPHYFNGNNSRPVIAVASPTSPATVINYNSTFTINFTLPSGCTLQSASLLSPGSVAHIHDPNQRLVELGIVSSSATTATLATPVNPTKAPYGYYMLFIVDSAGQVSAAAWFRFL